MGKQAGAKWLKISCHLALAILKKIVIPEHTGFPIPERR
jgi:hypothetical protein